MISYAQNLEDGMLARAFKDKPDGFYIDVGAMDPVQGSVTKHFYDLGWRGINLEPDQRYFEKLLSARPRDVNLAVCAGHVSEKRTFFLFDDQGISTLNSDFRDHFSAQGSQYQTVEIDVRPLSQICSEYNVSEIDFLKIDAEGWEKEILLGADFRKYRPKIVLLESTKPFSNEDISASWEPFLLSFDYLFVYFDGLNRFYIREESPELKAAFAFPPNVLDGFVHYSVVEQIGHLETKVTELSSELKLTSELAEQLRREKDSESEKARLLSVEVQRLERSLEEVNRSVAKLQEEVLSARLWAGRLSQERAQERSRANHLERKLQQTV
jgi:heptosyltransferase II